MRRNGLRPIVFKRLYAKECSPMNGINFVLEDNGIATLTVDRPQVHNALDWKAMATFDEVVEAASQSSAIRALIVTGSGKSFVSGGDLKDLANYPKRRDGLRLATLMGKALEKLKALPVPTIAAINGPARGGGAEIAVACDQRVMAETADIGFVHARLGITTAWGGARYLLYIVGYPRALELLTTGQVLDADEAHALGLVDHVAPDGTAMERAREIALQMAQHPTEAVQAAKRLLRYAMERPLIAKHEERRIFASLWDSEFRRSE